MQDKEARKQIQELQKDIAGLRSQIATIQINTNFGTGLISRAPTSVKEIVAKILDHLGLELTWRDASAELEKKP